MKSKSLILALICLFTLNMTFAQPFQKTIGVNNKNYHDLNIEPIFDGTGTDDYIVAGNLFDAAMLNEEITLKRLDGNGNVIWIKTYTHTSLQHARVFDMVIHLDLIFITGSIDVFDTITSAFTKRTFIAQIDAINGNIIGANYYDILSTQFTTRGLHISYTQSDADGDGVGDPGFVVGGFFSDCYNLDTTCTFNNIGFVMRTDMALNPIWITELDASNPIDNQDYDFVNGITETNDGFFITGSGTGITNNNVVQQEILAHKIDFQGTFVWDQSYIFGNSNDVSVDAYYDANTNDIFMLCNYSVSHYFGVTVFSNGGVYDPSRSWIASANDLNRYGFKIMEPMGNSNNLLITGYDRDENWTSGGSNFFGNTNIFVHEFAKATGLQVGNSYQYLVPHTEPIGDEFNFWSGQLPLIFYPDITFQKVDATGVNNFYHVGYRTNTPGGFTETELFETTVSKRNVCERLGIQLTPNPFTPQYSLVTSAHISVVEVPLVLNDMPISFTEEFCDPTMSVDENFKDKSLLYPNPASDYVYITGKELRSYRILEANGRLVSEGVLKNNDPIFIGNLSNGLYFIQVTDDSGRIENFKLIKK